MNTLADVGKEVSLDEETWTAQWRGLACHLKARLAPRTAAVFSGTGPGFPIETFKAVGIEAVALEFLGSSASPFPENRQPGESPGSFSSAQAGPALAEFDVVVCVQPLDGEAAEQAISRLTQVADAILFCPIPREIQGQDPAAQYPAEHWIILFENRGFSLDLSMETTFFGSPVWLFRKRRHLHFVLSRPLRVLILSPDLDNACGEVRLLRPLSYLQREMLVEIRAYHCNKKNPPPLDHVDWADILILQRVKSVAWRPYVHRARKRGIPVIYEIDDNLFELPALHPEAKSRLSRRLRNYKYSWYIRHAQAITTSTRSLAAYLGRFERPVYLLRNYVDDAPSLVETPCNSPRKNNAVITIGYAGSPTHIGDFEPLLGPIKKVSALFGDHVKFHFRGYVPPVLSESRNVSVDSKLLPYGEYLRELSRSRMDVALAPLLQNSLNECKSNLKHLEYSMSGIPGIYSPVGPYRDSIHDGVTGILVNENTEEQWFETLCYVLRNPDLLDDIRVKAKAFVRDHYRLRDHYREWWDTYVEILLSASQRLL